MPIAVDKFPMFQDSAWWFFNETNLLICGGGRETWRGNMKNSYRVTLSGDRGTVTTLNCMHTRRAYHGVYPFRGEVYAFGGRDEYGNELDDFEAFSEST